MSYITQIPDPPIGRVLGKCCCGTAGRHIKSSLNNMINNHKIELSIIITITAWAIICTTLFCVAAGSDVYLPKIWMAFAGLTFCLPVTLLLCFCAVSTCIYCRRIYSIAEDEYQQSENPGVYESWHVNKSVMIYNDNEDPIVKVMGSDYSVDVSVEL